jgi:hypothetical protein
MGFTVTPSGRRLAMAVLLVLATAGGVLRHFADNPSTLRDVGTLLLVLWLPAVGNLVAFLVRKIPVRPPAPRVADFPPGSNFAPHLLAQLDPVPVPEGALQAMDPHDRRCTIVAGQQAFTVRLDEPVVARFATGQAQSLALELLRPDVARQHLPVGREFHLLAGMTAVAKGRVLEVVG